MFNENVPESKLTFQISLTAICVAVRRQEFEIFQKRPERSDPTAIYFCPAVAFGTELDNILVVRV